MTNIKKYEPLWGTWYIESLLGKGSFGEVYKIRRDAFSPDHYGNTGMTALEGLNHYSAVKIISVPQSDDDIKNMRKEGMDDASISSFLKALLADLVGEINLMNELRGNSNIVSFEDYQIIDKALPLPASSPDPRNTRSYPRLNDEVVPSAAVSSASERTTLSGWDLLIRMELLESLTSESFQQKFQEGSPSVHAEIVRLGIHICRALELCEQKKIIHRDIKPDNIFISQYGEYKLGDFGIARQLERTMSGLSKKGTYNYMAPEVFRGEPYNASVDIYSLGIVLYRFLNRNRLPFLPDFPQPITPYDQENALRKRMSGARLPDLKNVSPQLNALVLKACAFDRRERFPRPGDMRTALEEAAIARAEAEAEAVAEAGAVADAGAVAEAGAVTEAGTGTEAEATTEVRAFAGPAPETTSKETIILQGNAYERLPSPDKSAPDSQQQTRRRLVSVLLLLGALSIAAILCIAVLVNSFYNNLSTSGDDIPDPNNGQNGILSDDPRSNDTNTQNDNQNNKNALSQETIYQNLSRLISYPDSKRDMPARFTFTARILSDKESTNLSGETCEYIMAQIARNQAPFMLILNEPDNYPKKDDIVSVTCTLKEAFSWVEDNTKKTAIHIRLESFDSAEPTAPAINTSSELIVSTGIINFTGAHFSTFSFTHNYQSRITDPVIILYFNYTSEKGGSGPELDKLDRFEISLGEHETITKYKNRTGVTTYDKEANDLDSTALQAGKQAEPGKATRYYAKLAIPPNNQAKTLYLKAYNDDFKLIYMYTIDIAASSSAMN